jgi:hypothetical protein
MRLKAGGGKHYFLSATESCLSGQAKLGTNFSGCPGAVPEATGGPGRDAVTGPGHVRLRPPESDQTSSLVVAARTAVRPGAMP